MKGPVPPPVFVAVDVSNVTCRAYYAATAGREGQSVYGLARYNLGRMIDNILAESDAVRFAAALDADTNFRKALYPPYKGERSPKPDELARLLEEAPDLFKSRGAELYVADDHEADDVLGTLADRMLPFGWRTVIVTGDTDLFSMVSEGEGGAGVYVYREGKVYGPKEVMEHKKYGVAPIKIPLFKALSGDTSDNIPGVMGVGPVAARQICAKVSTVRKLYDGVEDPSNPLKLTKGVLSKLEACGRDQAALYERLARLVVRAPLRSL